MADPIIGATLQKSHVEWFQAYSVFRHSSSSFNATKEQNCGRSGNEVTSTVVPGIQVRIV